MIKSFYSIYLKINIARKRNVFWDHFEKIDFCPYLWKYQNSRKRYFSSGLLEKIVFVYIYQHFQKNDVILRSFWKSRPKYPKTSTFRGKVSYLEITFEKIGEKNPNISNCKEKERFLRILWKNSFLFICPKISTFLEKLCYSKITLKKSFFAHISENINISRKSKLYREQFE